MRIEDYNPVRTPSDEEALRQGFVFDRKKADRPVRWMEKYGRYTMGPQAGQPLRLMQYQKEWLWQLFGWVHETTGLRRFRTTLLSVPKKSAKTTMTALLTLYLERMDGEQRPVINLVGVDNNQASLLYTEAREFVAASPDLSKEFECSDFYKTIKCPATKGLISTCSAEVDTREGGNISAWIYDELYLFTGKRRKSWEISAGSGAARSQPLRIVISTAGSDRQSIMYELVKHSWAIESGEAKDVRFLGMTWGPRPGEEFDPHDEATWFKYNPALGTTMTLDSFVADYEQAKISPTSFSDWKQRRLNSWENSGENRLISADDWAACDEPVRWKLEEIADQGVFISAGLDLSSTTDLSAFVLIAGDNVSGIDVHCWAWIPEVEAQRREKVNAIPYERWREQGWIEFTGGSRIDYDRIHARVKEVFEKTSFPRLYADAFNSQLINSEFLKHGIPFTTIRGGYISQNAPTKELERLVAEGLVRHGGNEMLTWCVSNAVAKRDGSGNVMIDKDKSTHKIDPLQALVNAVAGLVDVQIAAASEPAPITSGKILFRPFGGGQTNRRR